MVLISLLEFLFPPKCCMCSKILSSGSRICICETCATEIDYFSDNVILMDLPGAAEAYCDGVICVGRYCASFKKSLKRFKFSNKPSYYRAFGKLLATKLQSVKKLGEVDIIIPVPMHKSRQRQRGYNQAALIAGYVARELGIKMESRLLIKTKETASQSVLGKSERVCNLEGAFAIRNPERIKGKSILLIDDIVTTGSTINQCSKALKVSGAARIIAGVVATTRVM